MGPIVCNHKEKKRKRKTNGAKQANPQPVIHTLHCSFPHILPYACLIQLARDQRFKERYARCLHNACGKARIAEVNLVP